MSIRAKLVLAIAAGVVVLGAATGLLLRASGERAIRIAAEQAITAAGHSFAAMERADVEKLDTALRALSMNAAIQDAFARRDRARLAAVAAPVFAALKENHDVTHLYFIEPEPSRKVVLRAHRPELAGDVVSRATLMRAVDTLAVGAGLELGKTAFALRVVRPWYDRDGELVGFAELAEEIDHFLVRMKHQTGDEYGLVLEKGFLDEKAWASAREGRRNNWNDQPRTVVVNATVPEQEVTAFAGDVSSIPDGGLLLAEEERGEKVLARGIVPVKDAAGRRVGGLLVLHDITAVHAAMHAARRGLLAAVLGVTVAFGLLLLAIVDRYVFRRLDDLRRSMDGLTGRLAAGDRDLRVPAAAARDEVGRTEDAISRFVQEVVSAGRGAGGGSAAERH